MKCVKLDRERYNVKTSRFSWGELESLITADVVNGKRMYVGDASRPNFLTWLITLNGASLSTDMAQRTVEIQLAEPSYDSGWEEQVRAFIHDHREAILADAVGILRRPAKTIERLTRWATWEGEVLSRLDAPGELVDLILQRRSEADVEEEEGGIVEDYFAGRLRGLGYDPERDDIFIPSTISTKWYNAATGERHRTTGATGRIKQMANEGRLERLQDGRHPSSRKRGCRWIGEHVDLNDHVKTDLGQRLREVIETGKDREF